MGAGLNWSGALLPTAGAFALVVAILVAAGRSSARGASRPSGTVRLEVLIRTAAGGYLVFVAIVAAFAPFTTRRPSSTVASAVVQGAALTFGITTIFGALTAVRSWFGRRRLRTPP